MRDGRNISGLERLTFEEARIYDAPMTASPPPPRRPPPSSSYPLDAIRLAVEKPIRSVSRHVLDGLQAAIVAGTTSMSRPTDPTAGVATDVSWSCGGDPPGFPGSAFMGPTGAETMDGPVFDGLRRALKAMRSEFRLEPREDRPHRLPWTLVYRDDDLAVFLVRRTRKPAQFSAMYVEREGDEWGFGGYRDDCRPRPLITHGLGNSEWRIDSESPPASDSASFPIEVMEHECASGRPATGRIADPIVEYGEDAITVIVPVRHVEGRSATCQGNPWTPLLLELDEPIGERRILDGGPWPPEQRWPSR